jgi:phosphonoacetaldehyde hydrolase
VYPRDAEVRQADYRGRVRAAILDWAGTTVDFGSCAPVVVFVKVFREAGIDVTLAEARLPMGTNKRDHIRAVGRMPRIAEQWQGKHGRAMSEADIDVLYKAFLPQQVKAVAERAQVLPGVAEAIAILRQRGIAIGSTTGYPAEVMAELSRCAAQQGYEPQNVITASDVPDGRPAPWMVFESARRLAVYPLSAVVVVDDTTAGVKAGRHAGAWVVGVARTGNEVGLTEEELEALPFGERRQRIGRAAQALSKAGAHYVVESSADLPAVVEHIDRRLAQGQRP